VHSRPARWDNQIGVQPAMAAPDSISGDGVFPSTHWSAVLAAGQDNSRAAEALAELCRTYWYPLYAYVRRLGHAPEAAKDLTQGFFEHLLEVDLVARADAAKGRFRSFLLGAMKRFLGSEQARARAQKRGGAECFVSIDTQLAERRYGLDLADRLSPDLLFDHHWAMTILDQAFTLMEAEFRRTGREALFERLSPYLQGDRNGTHAEAAQALGTTEATVKVAVHQMRRRYRELLRSVTLETVPQPVEIDEELRYLLAVLNRR